MVISISQTIGRRNSPGLNRWPTSVAASGDRSTPRPRGWRGFLVLAAILLTLLVLAVPSALADSPRAFEQVSPADSGSYDVRSPQGCTLYFCPASQAFATGFMRFVSADGSRVVYTNTLNGVADGALNGVDVFAAFRGSAGWAASNVSPATPFSPNAQLPADGRLVDNFIAASADASSVLFTPINSIPWGVSLDPADPTVLDPHSPVDLYQQAGPDSSQWISRGPEAPPTEYPDIFDGMSADGRTVVWESREAIMPGQSDLGFNNVYERTNGVTSRVSVSSDGSSPESGLSFIAGEGGVPGRIGHSVSQDGTRVFFMSREHLTPQAPSDGSLSLYLHSGSQTILVAAGSDQAPVNPLTLKYEDATPDGSHVYYTLEQASTNVPYALYDYNVATRTSSLVSADQNGDPSGDPNQTVGYVTSSADGSHVYFVSEAPLDPANQGPDQQNYGLFERAAGHTRFIASLPETNLHTFDKGCEASYDGGLACPVPVYSARASVDGSRLFFTTLGRLTPDAQRPPTDAEGHPLYDVYVYDDTTHQITRVSQGPSGGDGPYSATMAIFPVNSEGGNSNLGADPRDISTDGSKVFFSTAERLTPDAADNGNVKIYQWENGRTTLVSPGTGLEASPASAIYADSSADGSGVFFATSDSLSCADTDGGLVDIYDARIGGTAATCPQPAPPCQATNTCAAVAPESGLTPASSVFTSPGNTATVVNRVAASTHSQKHVTCRAKANKIKGATRRARALKRCPKTKPKPKSKKKT
jgi:hypothetical protein